MSLLSNLAPQAPEALLSLIGLYGAGSRATKFDLGMGVCRNVDGIVLQIGDGRFHGLVVRRGHTVRGYLSSDTPAAGAARCSPSKTGFVSAAWALSR